MIKGLTGRELAGITTAILRTQIPRVRKAATNSNVLIVITNDVLLALGIPLNKKGALERELLNKMQNTKALPDERYVHKIGKDIGILVKHTAAIGTIKNILINYSTKFHKPEELDLDTIVDNRAYAASGRAYDFLSSQGLGLSKKELVEALDVLPAKRINIQVDSKTHVIDVKANIQGVLNKVSGLDLEANIIFPLPADIQAQLNKTGEEKFVQQVTFKLQQAIEKSLDSRTAVSIAAVDDLITRMFLGKKVLKKRTFKSSGRAIYELKPVKAAVHHIPFQMRNTSVRKGTHFASMQQLRMEIGLNISEEIRKIMRKASDPVSKHYLRTQTGTFADSVDIGMPRKAKTSKSNRITVPFSYQNMPYSTFEQSNKQGSRGRDPRLIIGKAIKAVFKKKVLQKFSVLAEHRR